MIVVLLTVDNRKKKKKIFVYVTDIRGIVVYNRNKKFIYTIRKRREKKVKGGCFDG